MPIQLYSAILRERGINAKVSRSLIFRWERFYPSRISHAGERPILSYVSNFSLGLYSRRVKVYFADENAKKLPYHRWYRKAAATSEYLSFAGFNQSSIVTRRDTIREPVNLAYETFTLRSLLPVAQYESLPSEHYRNYVCTHFTFVP